MKSAKELLEQNDLDVKKFHVEKWGTDICLKELTMKQAQDISTLATKKGVPLTEVMVKALYYSMCDEDGNKFFDNLNQAKKLLEKNKRVVEQIFEWCNEINNQEPDEEELEKNLETEGS